MVRSLRWRLGAIFVSFLLLVAASVGATFLAIETQQADAAVINLAGRQRMLSQQMVWLALSRTNRPELAQAAQLFDQTLHALRDGGSTFETTNQPIDLPAASDAALRAQLDEAAYTWSIFRARLQQPDRLTLPEISTQLLAQLDRIVSAFEARAQAKLARLQIIQGAFLIAALALLAGGYLVVHRQLLKPLAVLERATQHMAQGDLAQPVLLARRDELGELARAFEMMRTEITAAHDQLEMRVEQRTHELASAFEFSQEIVAQIELERLLQSVTDRACALTQATSASLCLLEPLPALLTLVAASGAGVIPLNVRQTLDRYPARPVIGAGETVTVEAGCTGCAFLSAQAPGHCAVAPLRTGATTLGALCVARRNDAPFDADETRALTLLANSAAVAIANVRLLAEQKRQAEQAAAVAERERLAAELHDNLAQTLGFLNLKSDRACEMLAQRQLAEASGELTQMKNAIGAAYHQVRAALTGLREPAPQANDLLERLTACVDEARASTQLSIELNVADALALALPRVAQTQAYHIVREALTNIRRHAQARAAWVSVERQNGTACFVVEDDGRGFDLSAIDGQQHLGLNIMRTRAERCGGSLMVESAVGHGTKIVARLPAAESAP